MTFGVSLTTPTWMAPVKWSEAGHDAVFVDASRGLVRFIQVTRAEHQNYDHIHFVEILDKLSLHDDLRGVRFRKVKLYFVVPREREAEFMLPVRAADFLTNVVQVASSSTLAGMKTRSHEETMVGGCMARVEVIGADYRMDSGG
ncbi:hypothetical protein GN244_ATG07575 [Phytophthora infestans]|uniref:Crinkler (CRN) family protein n=1 Tax=Phytophthora infestans TaxID=4787 RepID=A0A833WWI5_PHYIN|nr:hypothetical protein GN244_ATG07575 [Phytophthora infestans]